jgi:predicted RNA binding protein YcfA (HicA-like mRNA interferase family)
MRSSDLILEVLALGWSLKRISGSHHIFKHPTFPGLVVIPHPKAEVPIGTLRSIRKVAKGQ